MDYGDVLAKAWRIIWKHKVLWIFGIFAGCSRGGGGGSGGGGTRGWGQSPAPGQQPFQEFSAQIERFIQQAGQWISDNPWIIILFVVVVLILVATAIFLGTVGTIGLLRGALKADGGAERIAFGEIFRESMPFFWRVFLLGLLMAFLMLLVLTIVGVFGALFALATFGIGAIILIPLLCVLVPVLWAASLVIRQATAAMVLENLGIADGLRRGWQVVRKNVGPVLLVWLITVVLDLVVGVALAIPILITVVPAMIAFATSGGEFPTGILTVTALCFVLYIPVLIIAEGILTAYTETVWALTYLRLTRPAQTTDIPQALPANA